MKFTLTPMTRPAGSRFDLVVQIMFEGDARQSTTVVAGSGYTTVDQATNGFFAPDVQARLWARARQLAPGARVPMTVRPVSRNQPTHPVSAPAPAAGAVMTSDVARIYGDAPILKPSPSPIGNAGTMRLDAQGNATLRPDANNPGVAVMTSQFFDPATQTTVPRPERARVERAAPAKPGSMRLHLAAAARGLTWQQLALALRERGLGDFKTHMAFVPDEVLAKLT